MTTDADINDKTTGDNADTDNGDMSVNTDQVNPDHGNTAPPSTNDGPASTNDDPSSNGGDDASEKGWREKMAGDDEKFLKQLKRFGSEEDFGKAYREMEKSKAQIKKPLPEDPSEEELAAWRKDNGIPETPEGYDIKLPEGMVLGEDDKPMIDGFLEAMHGQNAHGDTVNKALEWYFSTQESQQVQAQEAERVAAQETVKALREEWGPEYKANHGMIKAWLDRQPDGIGEMLLNKRDAEGNPIFNNPEFAKWLNNHIRQTDPSATVIHDAEMSGSSVQGEIAKIQKVIRDNPEEYKKDKKMQARLSELSSIKNRMSGQAA